MAEVDNRTIIIMVEMVEPKRNQTLSLMFPKKLKSRKKIMRMQLLRMKIFHQGLERMKIFHQRMKVFYQRMKMPVIQELEGIKRRTIRKRIKVIRVIVLKVKRIRKKLRTRGRMIRNLL